MLSLSSGPSGSGSGRVSGVWEFFEKWSPRKQDAPCVVRSWHSMEGWLTPSAAIQKFEGFEVLFSEGSKVNFRPYLQPYIELTTLKPGWASELKHQYMTTTMMWWSENLCPFPESSNTNHSQSKCLSDANWRPMERSTASNKCLGEKVWVWGRAEQLRIFQHHDYYHTVYPHNQLFLTKIPTLKETCIHNTKSQ